MSDTVIGAIIGALGTVLVSAIGAIAAVRSGLFNASSAERKDNYERISKLETQIDAHANLFHEQTLQMAKLQYDAHEKAVQLSRLQSELSACTDVRDKLTARVGQLEAEVRRLQDAK